MCFILNLVCMYYPVIAWMYMDWFVFLCQTGQIKWQFIASDMQALAELSFLTWPRSSQNVELSFNWSICAASGTDLLDNCNITNCKE